MESDVFFYFIAIGAGLTFGVSGVAIPALLLYNKLKDRGARKHERIEKRSSRA